MTRRKRHARRPRRAHAMRRRARMVALHAPARDARRRARCASASPSTTSSLAASVPASAPPVASSRFIHRSTPSSSSSAGRRTIGVGRARGRGAVCLRSMPSRTRADHGASVTSFARPSTVEPGSDVHLGHRPGDARADLVLHLHRLQDQQALTDFDRVPLRDQHLDHATRHGALHRLVAARHGGLLRLLGGAHPLALDAHVRAVAAGDRPELRRRPLRRQVHHLAVHADAELRADDHHVDVDRFAVEAGLERSAGELDGSTRTGLAPESGSRVT